ncbi:MAG: helix-turn-helix transcriptional regulator [Roseburia sp.]|nr:helix-turn-helix transcriptional regulator [Roseburia sp.]
MQITDETMNLILKEVSRNISMERKRRGISMSQLADMANLSVSHISKLERAQCDIGLKSLLRIAAAFEMEAAEFIPEEPETDFSSVEVKTTNGERFERIVRDADPRVVEIILKMALCLKKNYEHTFS